MQLWYTQILPGTGKVVGKYNDKPVAVRNNYGEGSILWVPSIVEIGVWVNSSIPLSNLLRKETEGKIKQLPFHFNVYHENCFIYALKTSDGYITVIINGNSATEKIDIISTRQMKSKLLYERGWGY